MDLVNDFLREQLERCYRLGDLYPESHPDEEVEPWDRSSILETYNRARADEKGGAR